MRRRSFFIALILVVLLAGTAMAVELVIKDESGAIIDQYTVSDTGNIEITVDTGTPPVPGAPTLSLSPNSLPSITEGANYAQNITMTGSGGAGPPYTTTCAPVSAGVTASTGGSNTCTITATQPAPGTYSASFTVDDGAKQTTLFRSFTVNADSGGTVDPPGVETLTDYVGLTNVPIPAYGVKYYKFTIPQSQSGASHGMQVTMSTFDWRTNQDMVFSYGSPYPVSSDYPIGTSNYKAGNLIHGSKKWANISPGSSNETIWIFSNLAAGDYYVMIRNTSNITGKFGLFFSAW